MALLAAKGLESSSEVGAKYVESVRKQFEIWLFSDNAAARWVSAYLNFQHQTAWAARVSDDVTSIQQALISWLQPATDAAKKRAGAWRRYREILVRLPDLKETMFAEQFGVRKVFVQPVARYKVAGMASEIGAKIPDVANLIAGLVSERVPGDELILLCGGPGSGKSTLCRVIASELASNEEMHPVFLKLRRLQDTQEIANFVETQLQKEGIIDKFSDLSQRGQDGPAVCGISTLP
jgi:ATPase subunit of ABC transporter with duplicated ATPase domains